MSWRILFREERCIACGACAVACMDQKDLAEPLRRCYTEERGRGAAVMMTYRSDSCLHCGDAPCLRACGRGCITRDEDTGFLVYDNGACIGCGRCRAACPVGAPVMIEGKMHKCDGCAERVKAGLLPACVKVCPMEALALVKA